MTIEENNSWFITTRVAKDQEGQKGLRTYSRKSWGMDNVTRRGKT
jgi:hypothetical protein